MPEPQPTHHGAPTAGATAQAEMGDLLVRDLDRGELTAELQQRAQRRYRPPGSDTTRTFH